MKITIKKCLTRLLALVVIVSMACPYALAASFDDLQEAISAESLPSKPESDDSQAGEDSGEADTSDAGNDDSQTGESSDNVDPSDAGNGDSQANEDGDNVDPSDVGDGGSQSDESDDNVDSSDEGDRDSQTDEGGEAEPSGVDDGDSQTIKTSDDAGLSDTGSNDQQPTDPHANGTRFQHTDGSYRYGYSWNDNLDNPNSKTSSDDKYDSSDPSDLANLVKEIVKGWWGIEAWDDEGTRNVKLNEDVTYDSENDNTKSITIDNKKVDLDLGGNKIDGGGKIEIIEKTDSVNGDFIDTVDKTEEGKNNGSSVIRLENGADVTIRNGGITGGRGGSGGVSGSLGSGNGGGIYSANSDLTLENVDIYGNYATYGGGIFFETNDGDKSSTVSTNTFTMTGGSIHDNALVSWGNGGGIYTKGHGNDRVIANMTDVEIDHNNGSSYGGGIRTWGTDITLNNVDVTNNQGWEEGGGIVVSSKSNLIMNGGSITGNRTPGNKNGGGGLELDGTNDTATLNGVTITGNTTNGHGGGIFLYQRPDGKTSTLILGEGNKIYGNTSPAGRSDIYANIGTTIKGVDKAPLAPDQWMFDGWYTGNGNDDKYTSSEPVEGSAVDLAGNVTYTVVHEYYTVDTTTVDTVVRTIQRTILRTIQRTFLNGTMVDESVVNETVLDETVVDETVEPGEPQETKQTLDGSTPILIAFKGIDKNGNGMKFINLDSIEKLLSLGDVSYTYEDLLKNFELTNDTDQNVITLKYKRYENTMGDPTSRDEYIAQYEDEYNDVYIYDDDDAPEVPAPTPTPETIPDEPTPLVDIPEAPEQPTVDLSEEPTVEVPEEPIPLAEIPEEEVPLAEIPEEEVPLAEIPEEPVPLADVPMTGDGFQSTGLLVLFGCAALGWLALSKKREDEI